MNIFLYVGIFVLASFLSFASGTSVGAITALTPIIAGLVAIENISISLIGASLLGGAMFGDNLSFISDTTIAATQSQNCQMKDKFWVNIRIALPAAVVTSVILICVGFYQPSVDFASQENTIQWTQIIPYIVVVLLAIMGLNVLVTLFLGVMSAGILALSHGLELMDIVKNIYTGFESMHEIFLVFMLMGGLSAMIQKEGGIQFLVRTIERFMTTPAKAKMGIGLLVGIVDAAIANNTIAIIITSPVARQISNRFSLRSSHVASILDIFSCIVQEILPYGAQMLLLISMLGVEVDYLSLVMQTYYIWLLLLISVLFFTFYRPNHLSKNNEPV